MHIVVTLLSWYISAKFLCCMMVLKRGFWLFSQGNGESLPRHQHSASQNLGRERFLSVFCFLRCSVSLSILWLACLFINCFVCACSAAKQRSEVGDVDAWTKKLDTDMCTIESDVAVESDVKPVKRASESQKLSVTMAFESEDNPEKVRRKFC